MRSTAATPPPPATVAALSLVDLPRVLPVPQSVEDVDTARRLAAGGPHSSLSPHLIGGGSGISVPVVASSDQLDGRMSAVAASAVDQQQRSTSPGASTGGGGALLSPSSSSCCWNPPPVSIVISSLRMSNLSTALGSGGALGAGGGGGSAGGGVMASSRMHSARLPMDLPVLDAAPVMTVQDHIVSSLSHAHPLLQPSPMSSDQEGSSQTSAVHAAAPVAAGAAAAPTAVIVTVPPALQLKNVTSTTENTNATAAVKKPTTKIQPSSSAVAGGGESASQQLQRREPKSQTVTEPKSRSLVAAAVRSSSKQQPPQPTPPPPPPPTLRLRLPVVPGDGHADPAGSAADFVPSFTTSITHAKSASAVTSTAIDGEVPPPLVAFSSAKVVWPPTPASGASLSDFAAARRSESPPIVAAIAVGGGGGGAATALMSWEALRAQLIPPAAAAAGRGHSPSPSPPPPTMHPYPSSAGSSGAFRFTTAALLMSGDAAPPLLTGDRRVPSHNPTRPSTASASRRLAQPTQSFLSKTHAKGFLAKLVGVPLSTSSFAPLSSSLNTNVRKAPSATRGAAATTASATTATNHNDEPQQRSVSTAGHVSSDGPSQTSKLLDTIQQELDRGAVILGDSGSQQRSSSESQQQQQPPSRPSVSGTTRRFAEEMSIFERLATIGTESCPLPQKESSPMNRTAVHRSHGVNPHTAAATPPQPQHPAAHSTPPPRFVKKGGRGVDDVSYDTAAVQGAHMIVSSVAPSVVHEKGHALWVGNLRRPNSSAAPALLTSPMKVTVPQAPPNSIWGRLYDDGIRTQQQRSAAPPPPDTTPHHLHGNSQHPSASKTTAPGPSSSHKTVVTPLPQKAAQQQQHRAAPLSPAVSAGDATRQHPYGSAGMVRDVVQRLYDREVRKRRERDVVQQQQQTSSTVAPLRAAPSAATSMSKRVAAAVAGAPPPPPQLVTALPGRKLATAGRHQQTTTPAGSSSIPISASGQRKVSSSAAAAASSSARVGTAAAPSRVNGAAPTASAAGGPLPKSPMISGVRAPKSPVFIMADVAEGIAAALNRSTNGRDPTPLSLSTHQHIDPKQQQQPLVATASSESTQLGGGNRTHLLHSRTSSYVPVVSPAVTSPIAASLPPFVGTHTPPPPPPAAAAMRVLSPVTTTSVETAATRLEHHHDNDAPTALPLTWDDEAKQHHPQPLSASPLISKLHAATRHVRKHRAAAAHQDDDGSDGGFNDWSIRDDDDEDEDTSVLMSAAPPVLPQASAAAAEAAALDDDAKWALATPRNDNQSSDVAVDDVSQQQQQHLNNLEVTNMATDAAAAEGVQTPGTADVHRPLTQATATVTDVPPPMVTIKPLDFSKLRLR